MASLPAWYPDPDERKPAPGPLLLVQAFLNTRDLEEETDVLADEKDAGRWLRAAGLLPRGVSVGPGDLELMRTIRESIRGLLADAGDAGGAAEHVEALRAIAQTGHPQLTIDDRGLVSVDNAQHETLADGLFELLLIIRGAQADGTWERLKACGNPDCRWVFYDRSRNQQGSWCDMAVCGNRLKNRKLRERRR